MDHYGGFSQGDIRTKEKSKRFGRWFVIISFVIVLLVIIMSDGNENTGSNIFSGTRGNDEIVSITPLEELTVLQGQNFNFPVFIHNPTEDKYVLTSVAFDDEFLKTFTIVSSEPKQNSKVDVDQMNYSIEIDPYDFVSIDFEIIPSVQGKYSGEIEICLENRRCSYQSFEIVVTNGIYSGED